jgi:hypothetical protein
MHADHLPGCCGSVSKVRTARERAGASESPSPLFMLSRLYAKVVRVFQTTTSWGCATTGQQISQKPGLQSIQAQRSLLALIV